MRKLSTYPDIALATLDKSPLKILKSELSFLLLAALPDVWVSIFEA
jgi:hypothetical protein